MSGRKSRNKGYRGEKELLELLKAQGLRIDRVYASGAGKYELADFIAEINGNKYTIECKRELKLPITGLESRKKEADILIMRQNNDTWKVYVELDILLQLIKV